MKTSTVAGGATNRSLAITLLLSGLLVGTLDIVAACVSYMIKTGGNPKVVLVYIASAVFGKEAFSGGDGMAAIGLLFHYLIAFGWTVLFFVIYPFVSTRIKNAWLLGVVYGLVVWSGMNLIVLPLTALTHSPITLNGALVAATVLIVAIGIPLSFMARRYYKPAT
ncbi:MAG: DUF1440 domain-containing protein [Bacteroidia bacterium]|nr:DUF1440 domain-containing protein [Bacteroidia bacterium]